MSPKDPNFKTYNDVKNKELKYINKFFKHTHVGADLMLMDLFPNLKEITESMGAYFALKDNVKEADPANPNYSVVAVGDGSTPRTAGLCAFYSRWECYSIDPLMGSKTKWNRISRLHKIKARVEDSPLTIEGNGAILAVHSHAPIPETLKAIQFKGKRSLVFIPCCVRKFPKLLPTKVWRDEAILSVENQVYVWNCI